MSDQGQKKGWWSKFVETTPSEPKQPAAPSVDELTAQVSQMRTSTVAPVHITLPQSPELQGTEFVTIDQVYEMANLSNKERSIFKVNDLLAALPDLPLEVKRNTLAGLIPATGLTVAELMDDANARLQLLQQVDVQTQQDTAELIAAKQAEIERLKQQVEQLTVEINERQLGQEKQSQVLKNEAVSISEIVKFI